MQADSVSGGSFGTGGGRMETGRENKTSSNQ